MDFESITIPLQEARVKVGVGFCQSMLFHNGKRFKGYFKPEKANQYRSLCEIGGKLCIVDSAKQIFSTTLQRTISSPEDAFFVAQ